MKVHLVSPLRKGGANIAGRALLPPLGLMYIAAYTPPGVDVRIIDENAERIDFSDRPDLVAITTLTATAARACETATRYREPGVRVVVGGVHASMLPEEALRYADSVVVGEADTFWENVVSDAEAGRLEEVYRPAHVLDFERPLRPRRDLIDRRACWSANAVQTVRGCPHDCDFCCVTAPSGRLYRFHDPDDVLAEIEKLPRNRVPGRTIVPFVDAEAAPDRNRHEALFRGLAHLRVFQGSRATIGFAEDEESVALAADSGCRLPLIGPEGLALTTDGTGCLQEEVERFEQALSLLDRHGINAICDFHFGFDSDDATTPASAVGFSKRLGLPPARFMRLTPYPGTRIHDGLLEEGRLERGYWFDPSWEGKPVFNPRRMGAEELERAVARAHRSFYSPGCILGRMPGDFRSAYLLPLNFLYDLAVRAGSGG